ncbi:hypothetical protein [Methylobacter sp.]|uniref:hypothetical protein n=1 Tax=Methylobacter sp. TaxID=2051955 RepID=UPI0011F864B9|nr:hypothetical protein [Methylobacter sp.]TAK61267.1 MAG: hypothetical protein EPO18_14565 [Methylobacter sp.]
MKAYKFNVYRKLMKAVFWIVAWESVSYVGQVLADETSNIARHRFENWERASDSELDQLRGGFVLPNGMNIDFSLERISSLNGTVVSSSFFQLPENTLLSQNGTMNQALDLAGSGLSSVIQNNVDNQIIRTVTDINIVVSNLKNIDLNNSGMAFNNLILPNAH